LTSTYLHVNLNINATLDLDFDGIGSFVSQRCLREVRCRECTRSRWPASWRA